jgi:hypothetical protein
MYYFDFLNLEAYNLIQKFQKKDKICLVHEIFDDEIDIWKFWIILRDEKHEYICISYIWENWMDDEIFGGENQNKNQYKFKDSIPITKIDYLTYYSLKEIVENENSDKKLKKIFIELYPNLKDKYKQKKYED